MRRAAVTLVAVLAAACSRGPDDEAKRRLFSPDAPQGGAAGAFDFERPATALAFGADDVARRLGSFEWTAAVDWSVSRQGDDAQRVRALEHHRVRQSATGDFDVLAEIDPGLGPGSETGKEVVFAGGMTYARAKHAPFRERPTDRGRDARRFRDESFGLSAAVARLYGDALAMAPAGAVTVLGRPAKRFKLSLVKPSTASAPAPRPADAPSASKDDGRQGARPPDDDTIRRLGFLDGRVPTSADGELVLDAATGAPLRVRLAGAFAVKDQPSIRSTVEVLAQVKALGGEVGAIAAPKGALPDERKAAGVTGALDAAGLRKRGDERKGDRGEPADEASE